MTEQDIKPYPFTGKVKCECSERPKQGNPLCSKGHWNSEGTTLTNHPMPR